MAGGVLPHRSPALFHVEVPALFHVEVAYNSSSGAPARGQPCAITSFTSMTVQADAIKQAEVTRGKFKAELRENERLVVDFPADMR